MNQLNIDFSAPVKDPQFDGSTYDAQQDYARLNRQLRVVRDLMIDGLWRTLRSIASATGEPEASVSARLRDLRKPKFGAHTVARKRIKENGGTHEYRVTKVLHGS